MCRCMYVHATTKYYTYSGTHNGPSEKRTPMLQRTLAVLRINNASNLREADASGFRTVDKSSTRVLPNVYLT